MLCSARRLLLLLLELCFVSSSILFAAVQGTTTTTTTSSPWRPTPLRASPHTVLLSANGTTISIHMRYKTWDGNFLDVVELAAGMKFFFFRRSRAARPEAILSFFLRVVFPLKPKHYTTATHKKQERASSTVSGGPGPLSPAAGHRGAADPRGRR